MNMEKSHLLGVALLSAGIGVPAAFFTIALPAMMRDGGGSLMEVGLIYLVWLPSVAKWIWSPWVEARSATGPARVRLTRWLSISLGLCFLPVAWLADQMAITGLVILSVVSAALGLTIQLVIAGWSMSTLSDEDRGRVNGYVAGGMVAGGVLGGGIAPWLAGQFGWAPVVVSMALIIAATGLAGNVLRSGHAAQDTPAKIKFRTLIDVFAGPRGKRFLMTVLVLTAAGSVDMTLTARLIDAGLSMTQAALLLGTVATVLMIPLRFLRAMQLHIWARGGPVWQSVWPKRWFCSYLRRHLPSINGPSEGWRFWNSCSPPVLQWQHGKSIWRIMLRENRSPDLRH